MFKTWIVVCLMSFAGSVLFSREFNPEVSVITSVYDDTEFIEGFLEDIEKQTIFPEVEFIIINANSPGNEEPYILSFAKKNPNVNYIKLTEDPGLYAVWNIGIKMAKGRYITNANLDDRMAYFALETMKQTLDENPNVGLVYSDALVTHRPNETFEKNTMEFVYHAPDFSWDRKTLRHCLPGHHPMWKKSLHEKFGYFDESYFIQGDFEMWLRLLSNKIEFLRIPKVTGLALINKGGLSHSPKHKKVRLLEHNKIGAKYKDFYDSLPN